MSRVYFVSPYKEALRWFRAEYPELAENATPVDYFSRDIVESLGEDDVVVGALSIPLAAEVRARGARYFHINLRVPKARRGRELSAGDMQSFGAHLLEVFVKQERLLAPASWSEAETR